MTDADPLTAAYRGEERVVTVAFAAVLGQLGASPYIIMNCKVIFYTVLR